MIRYILFFTILLSACTPRPQQEDVLIEAQTIQAEALKIGDGVQKQLQELDQQRINIEVQGRALTSKELKFIADVNNLTSSFEEWQKEKPKLPAKLKGSSASLLKNQKDYLGAIQSIKEKVNSLTNN